MLAREVLGDPGSELIDQKIVLSGQQRDVLVISDVPKRSFPAANRAVAFQGPFDRIAELECDFSAVTRASLNGHKGLYMIERRS